LIHRGPAYTQMALFSRIDDRSDLQLVNHLGVTLGETILGRLDRDAFTEFDIDYDSNPVASDHDYAKDVRDIDADTPGRFNADSNRLFEASGSAGKVMIFAVRLDTFSKEAETAAFLYRHERSGRTHRNPPAHSGAFQRSAG
jgi:D-lactate dehydrogenase (quinone)